MSDGTGDGPRQISGVFPHLATAGDAPARFRVEVDVTGCGRWVHYTTLDAPAGGGASHTFPPGFSAHWLRLVADSDCTATAQLYYT